MINFEEFQRQSLIELKALLSEQEAQVLIDKYKEKITGWLSKGQVRFDELSELGKLLFESLQQGARLQFLKKLAQGSDFKAALLNFLESLIGSKQEIDKIVADSFALMKSKLEEFKTHTEIENILINYVLKRYRDSNHKIEVINFLQQSSIYKPLLVKIYKTHIIEIEKGFGADKANERFMNNLEMILPLLKGLKKQERQYEENEEKLDEILSDCRKQITKNFERAYLEQSRSIYHKCHSLNDAIELLESLKINLIKFYLGEAKHMMQKLFNQWLVNSKQSKDMLHRMETHFPIYIESTLNSIEMSAENFISLQYSDELKSLIHIEKEESAHELVATTAFTKLATTSKPDTAHLSVILSPTFDINSIKSEHNKKIIKQFIDLFNSLTPDLQQLFTLQRAENRKINPATAEQVDPWKPNKDQIRFLMNEEVLANLPNIVKSVSESWLKKLSELEQQKVKEEAEKKIETQSNPQSFWNNPEKKIATPSQGLHLHRRPPQPK